MGGPEKAFLPVIESIGGWCGEVCGVVGGGVGGDGGGGRGESNHFSAAWKERTRLDGERGGV